MGTSGNPAKKAAAKKAAPKQPTASNARDFKNRRKGMYVELPSGLVVRARRVELKTFLERGDVPNPLMEIVAEAIEQGDKSKPEDMIGTDEGKLNFDMIHDMYAMVENVVIACVVEPKVHPLPTVIDDDGEPVEKPTEEQIEDAKDDDLVYIDEVEDEDKMFLFQWVQGGTSDLATFRQEAGASLASLAEVASSQDQAKRDAGVAV